ncbi:MAG: pyruvate, water dikinase regulatory protein [Thiohalophilus sp.]|uniref:posphoenolpyruvate synthetase regulatory kinase/phosphorylase PpsR n=1 Tax=Thiohalophilus sp. TaxID=3028392 RepID=UPI0028707821|nr:pyruvate, water dikinase regulatory protein [Thiohalophilus sp.]MDR9436832.1 pyruvate, water dikinase regulatory protein [Thiohalophilus sp.]
MTGKRAVFFVSDSTAITAETLGHSLLTQFAGQSFDYRTLRFIDSEEKAREARDRINAAHRQQGLRPIVFSTLVVSDIHEIIASSEGLFIDFMDSFLSPLEEELGSRRVASVGHTHGVVTQEHYRHRMDAVNFALQNDDGGSIRQYERADLILVGVSRSGKTPTSVFLAIHYGVFVANYPLVDEELEESRLPTDLKPWRDKLFGLTIQPERLQQIRQERSPDSRYAALHQCQYEVRQVEALFRTNRIDYLDVTSKSIEEIATYILKATSLERHRL